jgi:hypothetical protein
MSILAARPGIVYRRGRLTAKNFTPRPGADTIAKPGQAPGLSAFVTLTLAQGEIAQEIDLALLQPPLQAIPDDPALGGTPGHVAITPCDASCAVDQQLLEAWAATRGQLPPHPLTQVVLDAVVDKHAG